MADDYELDKTSRAMRGEQPVESPTAELRQGVIKAVNVPAARVDVSLGGDTAVIPGVSHLSNYRPKVNDTCWVLVNGPDLLALDRTAALGPSVISDAASAFVNARQTRSSNSYGDLSTLGPQVTVSVSPSGRLLVQTSAWLYKDSIDGATDLGGAMSFALTGANSRSATDQECTALFASAAFVEAKLVAASKVTLLTGLVSGSTTVTAKYRNISAGDGHGTFEFRHVWAMPL